MIFDVKLVRFEIEMSYQFLISNSFEPLVFLNIVISINIVHLMKNYYSVWSNQLCGGCISFFVFFIYGKRWKVYVYIVFFIFYFEWKTNITLIYGPWKLQCPIQFNSGQEGSCVVNATQYEGLNLVGNKVGLRYSILEAHAYSSCSIRVSQHMN